MTATSILAFGSLILGGIVGSFLNVCIYRIPEGLSIVRPASRCPKCGYSIRWWQNIPVLGWVFLGGRCFNCKEAISIRYPFIEALTALLFLCTFIRFGCQGSTPVYWIFCSILVVLTFIDLDHQVLPNCLTIPGILIGFVSVVLFLPLSLVDSAFGVILGGGLLLAVAFGYRLVTGVEGMGMGDVKLLAMIGAFLGWQSIFPVVFLGSLAGTIVGIPLMLYRRAGSRLALPFGPFLSLGALLYLFAWSTIFSWYISVFFPRP